VYLGISLIMFLVFMCLDIVFYMRRVCPHRSPQANDLYTVSLTFSDHYLDSIDHQRLLLYPGLMID
jgi:hypothetical protein